MTRGRAASGYRDSTTLAWLITAVLLAAYLAVALIVWRRTAWVFADKARFDPQERSRLSRSSGVCWFGALFAAVWPLTVGAWLVHTRGIPYLGTRFLLPPGNVRHELDARETAEQERRIAELERQVEMR